MHTRLASAARHYATTLLRTRPRGHTIRFERQESTLGNRPYRTWPRSPNVRMQHRWASGEAMVTNHPGFGLDRSRRKNYWRTPMLFFSITGPRALAEEGLEVGGPRVGVHRPCCPRGAGSAQG